MSFAKLSIALLATLPFAIAGIASYGAVQAEADGGCCCGPQCTCESCDCTCVTGDCACEECCCQGGDACSCGVCAGADLSATTKVSLGERCCGPACGCEKCDCICDSGEGDCEDGCCLGGDVRSCCDASDAVDGKAACCKDKSACCQTETL